jgi:uncharacterized repeat protein (TIGR01451 family)
VTSLLLPAASWAAGPNFDAVSWLPLGCDRPDMVSPSSPAAASFAGDRANLPAFYAYDADYLYFRYRMDANPSGPGGFTQDSWTALMQVPSGDPFEYQYELALNGNTDTIEIWQNTNAQPVDFSPLFHDTPEKQLFTVPYSTESLARTVPANTSFNGQADWFVDFAFPVPTLVATGVIASAGDLAQALFFPATSTNPNNYNKSYLNCPFQPGTTLQISKAVTPTVAPQGTVTPVTYTIAVQNTGTLAATGVVVEDVSLPAFLANLAVKSATDDPGAAFTVESTNPLRVTSPTLAAGRRVTVEITADAMPDCSAGDFVNTASVHATNAFDRQASATLGGCVACTTDADCPSDNNACTVETCSGGVCSHEPSPSCVACTTDVDCARADNACMADACTNGVCTYSAIPGCVVSCTTAADCNDGDLCTTETCTAGVCGSKPAPSCSACTTAADCDDSNPCTTDVCGASGSCELTAIQGCRTCSSAADCDDSDACTTDTCTDGMCHSEAIAGCTPGGTGGTGTGGGTSSGGGSGSSGGGAGGGGDDGHGTGHAAEICGDCVDNDGDGLVDYEDPDCCQRTDPLTLSRMIMRLRPQAAADTLRLRSRGVAAAAASLDPRDGVTLQLSDSNGQLYCHDIDVTTTKAGLKHGVFRFRDKTGTLAAGLQRARFKIRKDGQLVFRATGSKMHLRNATDSGLTVTLRVGGMCMQTTAALRAKPAKLGSRNVFP